MASVDPYTQTYEYLWGLVLNSPDFTDSVRVGNRMNLAGDMRNPFKDVVRAADLPQVTLLPTDGTGNIGSNSNETMIMQNYTFGIDTGDLRLNQAGFLFPLKFAIIRALSSWCLTRGNLEWEGVKFLDDLNIPTSTDTITEIAAEGTNITSWESVLTVTTIMHITTSVLRYS